MISPHTGLSPKLYQLINTDKRFQPRHSGIFVILFLIYREKNHQQTVKQQPTHNEAVVSSVLTVEEAVAGLEEEQTCLGVIVIRGDAEGPQTFTLSQQLLFSGIGPLVRRGLSGGNRAALTQCSD